MAVFLDTEPETETEAVDTGVTWLSAPARADGRTLPFALALRAAAIGVAAHHRGHVLIELDPGWAPPARVQPTLLAIVHEAMENSYRHAGHGVTVIVRGEGSTLTIGDTGSGFDVADALAGDGEGLDRMRRLARERGLRLRVVSAVGIGTSVDIEIV